MTDEALEQLVDRFDPYNPDVVPRFWDVANGIRERCPVMHSDAHDDGFWIFTRFDEVRNGFGDNDGLSPVPVSTIPYNAAAVPLLPLQSDGTQHRDIRSFLHKYFRQPVISRFEAGVRDSVTRSIDSFIERGECEFISEFARRVPGEVIFGQVLGFPAADVERAYHWVLTIMHGHGTEESKIVYKQFTQLTEELLEQRRREPRRDDVVDALLYEDVSGQPMTNDEILRTLMFLIAAGLDTTAHSLGHIVVRLARRPELVERLTAHPELLPTAIEEFLRVDPPAGGLVRTATRDMEISGTQIREGDRVMLLVASANRDPREFADPEEADIERNPNRHLAWGYGTHFCVGAPLARLELRVALEELLARVTDIRVLDEHVHYDNGVSRGPEILDIAFTPGPRSGTVG